MRSLPLTALCAAALFAASCGSDDKAKPAPAAADVSSLAGAPTPLAEVHGQANRLLGGGADAFKKRLKGLEGFPVVVNKWASWCAPCRAELPYFQSQALKRGKQVAFLAVNSNDNDDDAREFMREFPVSYPSYSDPDLAVSAVFNGVQAFPTTAFYDKEGELAFVHQGGYATEKKLVENIERYAR